MNPRWQKLQRNIFMIFISMVTISVSLYYFLAEEFSVIQMREHVGAFGIWAPLLFILVYILGTIFIPSTPFMAIAGILFGFKYGLLYTIAGGLASSLIVFGISRKLGKEWVESILKSKHLERLEKYNSRLEQSGVIDLIILRIIPVMPFNVLNILMGVSRIRGEDYVAGTFLGLIPSNLAAVYFGTFIIKLI